MALSQMVAAIGDDGEHWWLVAPFFWTLWLVLVATVLFLVFRAKGRRWRGHDHAKAILAERLARGELSVDEFRERLGALR